MSGKPRWWTEEELELLFERDEWWYGSDVHPGPVGTHWGLYSQDYFGDSEPACVIAGVYGPPPPPRSA
mgnify:CR=1 FL=1